MKFNRLCSGLYYSDDNQYQIEREGKLWKLSTKTKTYSCRFDETIATLTASDAVPYSFRITCTSTGEVLESSEVFADRTRAARKAAHFTESLNGDCVIEILTVSRDGSRAVDLIDEDGNPRFDAPKPTYRLIDGTQGFPIGYAMSAPEAVQMWENLVKQDGGRDVVILDANGEDVTERFLMAEEPQEAPESVSEPVPMVSVDSLRADLNTGDYGEYLNDYRDSTSGVADAIAEIADNRTSIYYSDILSFISENPESLAEVIEQGLYDPTHGYNLYEHGQAAEYMLIERDLYEHIEDSLVLVALEFIERDLGKTEIPEDLAEKLPEWAEEAALDSMDYMPDRIREYFEEV